MSNSRGIHTVYAGWIFSCTYFSNPQRCLHHLSSPKHHREVREEDKREEGDMNIMWPVSQSHFYASCLCSLK